MGYFNYFIKCIIRNFSYKLCKPKVFITVLLSVIILFVLHSKGYCVEWSQDEIDFALNQLTSISNDMTSTVTNLTNLNINVTDIEKELNDINSTLSGINSMTSNISDKLTSIFNRVDSLNTTLTQLAQQQNIYYENVTNELEELKKILMGADLEVINETFFPTNFIRIEPSLSTNSSFEGKIVDGSPNCAYARLDYEFEGGYTYDIVCTSTYTGGSSRIYYTFDSMTTGSNIYLNYAGSFTPARASFTISPKKDSSVRLVFHNPSVFGWDMTWTITKKSAGSLSGINSTIEQGNQLQQEQNQLQQEQNDFLKQESSDSDVSVDSFNSVDANDITSSGLTGVFTNIYNSITSWSSKDINLPIPYTNKSIVIPANYTHNMLSSFGGSWIISFISSIYYFIVARFIIYSITSIINSIKSGSILETDSKNNITTDML